MSMEFSRYTNQTKLGMEFSIFAEPFTIYFGFIVWHRGFLWEFCR